MRDKALEAADLGAELIGIVLSAVRRLRVSSGGSRAVSHPRTEHRREVQRCREKTHESATQLGARARQQTHSSQAQ